MDSILDTIFCSRVFWAAWATINAVGFLVDTNPTWRMIYFCAAVLCGLVAIKPPKRT